MRKPDDGSVDFQQAVEHKDGVQKKSRNALTALDHLRGSCGQCQGRCSNVDCKGYFAKSCTVELLKKRLPITKWLPSYRLREFKGDMIAGLTLGLTVIPQSMAYAKIAELPTQYGLYTSFMCYFVYCFLGTARDVNLGPTAVLSLLTAEFTHQIPQLAALLAFICGVAQVIMGILNIGFLMEFISHTIINSFTSAAALAIIFSQIKKWLGLKGIPRDFARQLYWTIVKLPETQLWDCSLGIVCMCFLYLLKKLKVFKFKKSGVAAFVNFISTARNAIIIFIASALAAALHHHGQIPFTLTGNITSGIPSLSFPSSVIHLGGNVTLTTGQSFQKLGIGSVITPLVGLIEVIAIGKAFGKKNGYKVDSDQEFLALGVSNILGSFVSAYPVTGSFSRSAVAAQSGIQTPAANIVTGILVLLALAFLTPLFYFIPTSGLAAVIIMAVVDLVDFTMIRKLWIINKPDLVPWFVTFGISLLFGFEYGILIGVAVSLLFLLHPWAKPDVQISSLHDDSKEDLESGDNYSSEVKVSKLENITIISPSIGLLFPGGEHFEDKVFEGVKDGSVIFDFSSVMMMDYSAASCIKQLTTDLIKRNVKFVFINVKPSVEEKLAKSEIKNFRTAGSLEEATQILRTNEKKEVIVEIVINEDRFEAKSGSREEVVPLRQLNDAIRLDDSKMIDDVIHVDDKSN